MVEWKGCRGLDPAIAAQVTNAMPPYLIGMESRSPNPFSATDRGTWREDLPRLEGGVYAPDFGNLYYENIAPSHKAQERTGLPAKATCWEILTVRLGQYANEMAAKGIVLTDEMLQIQARYILYESNDTWNQTAADNPEWLDLFKKAHGLDFIPTTIGAQGQKVPGDLETYQDLGLRIPFAVQLKAYNDSAVGELTAMHGCQSRTSLVHTDAQFAIATRQRQEKQMEHDLWKILSKEGVLHDPATGKCKHTECEDNVFDSLTSESKNYAQTKVYRWCTYQLPPAEARKVAALTWPARVNDDVSDEEQRTKNIARGLMTLERMVGAEAESPQPETPQQWDNYLRRHRYELPRERAQRFATTTGPWIDSGMMAPTITTAEDATAANTTSTGAMMEFLGGEIGQHLPFAAHPHTADIPLADPDWPMPTTAAEQEAINRDIEELIAETTVAQTQQSIAAEMSFLETDYADAMETTDFDFDMEMDFDGIFDMPDETFGPVGGDL